MNHSTSGLPVYHQLLEFTQTYVHRVGDAIQTSHPLSSPSPPALNLSHHQGLFKWVSSSHQVAKVLEFQLQHQSFHEHPGLISFRMDWLDLLAIQGTLKSLLQHHSSQASILRHSAFFTVQLLHPYMTTGKVSLVTFFFCFPKKIPIWALWIVIKHHKRILIQHYTLEAQNTSTLTFKNITVEKGLFSSWK